MKPVIVALLALVAAAPAHSAVLVSKNMSQGRWPVMAPEASFHAGMPGARQHRNLRVENQLLALRREMLALRDTDGGTLSDEHRAYLQTKLDTILDEDKAMQKAF